MAVAPVFMPVPMVTSLGGLIFIIFTPVWCPWSCALIEMGWFLFTMRIADLNSAGPATVLMKNSGDCLDGTTILNPTLSNMPVTEWKVYRYTVLLE